MGDKIETAGKVIDLMAALKSSLDAHPESVMTREAPRMLTDEEQQAVAVARDGIAGADRVPLTPFGEAVRVLLSLLDRLTTTPPTKGHMQDSDAVKEAAWRAKNAEQTWNALTDSDRATLAEWFRGGTVNGVKLADALLRLTTTTPSAPQQEEAPRMLLSEREREALNRATALLLEGCMAETNHDRPCEKCIGHHRTLAALLDRFTATTPSTTEAELPLRQLEQSNQGLERLKVELEARLEATQARVKELEAELVNGVVNRLADAERRLSSSQQPTGSDEDTARLLLAVKKLNRGVNGVDATANRLSRVIEELTKIEAAFVGAGEVLDIAEGMAHREAAARAQDAFAPREEEAEDA